MKPLRTLMRSLLVNRAAWACAVALAPSAGHAQLTTTQPTEGEEQANESTDTKAHIADVFAVGPELVVVVRLAGDAAAQPHFLSIETANGEVRTAHLVEPMAGEQHVLVPGAVSPLDLARSFAAVLSGPDGTPTDALGFTLRADCWSADECELAAQPGSTGDAAPSTPELDAALSEGALPAGDLGAFAATHPHLLGDALTHGVGVARLALGDAAAAPAGDLAAEPAPPDPTCECWWASTNQLRPSWAQWASGCTGPACYDGYQGPGAAHRIRARYDGNLFNGSHSAEYYVEGESESSLALKCMWLLGWKTIVIKFFGMKFEFKVPVTGGECPKKCAGIVDINAEYYADLRAWVDTGWFGHASAAAQEEGRFSVNGAVLLNRVARVEKETSRNWGFELAIPGLGSIVIGNGSVKYNGKPTNDLAIEIKYSRNGSDGTVAHQIVASKSLSVPEPATALFEGKGLAYATGSTNNDSEGKTSMSYQYSMYGFAPCALNPQASVWNYYSYEGRTNQLRFNIMTFFAQRGLSVNP